MGPWNNLWLFTKKSITGIIIGVTISDRYLTFVSVRGDSMHPTFTASPTTFPGSLKGDLALAERFCLDKYRFSNGDVILFKCPSDHKQIFVKRLIALPGDWIQVPESSEILRIPEGHCWVEGDNAACSWDSRSFGPIPLGLVRGRVTHVVWPPWRMSQVERKMPEGRISSY
uniref:Mitochondrial inner membrane protease subunit 2 n=1 Tax=Ananas comosus var. bracteatus TaxID=296719 RepID=A0A6V7PYH7_ANACO|nr:unnamed protein product [Ananas comosus var. bracteatus]